MLTLNAIWFTLLATGLSYAAFFRRQPNRQKVIPPSQERVLILGASSGIGREIAHIYAARGARVCVVARREDKLEQVQNECLELTFSKDVILKSVADFSDPESLLHIRELLRLGQFFHPKSFIIAALF